MHRESQNLPTDTQSVSGDSVAASQISLRAPSQEGAPAQPVLLSRAGSRTSSTRSPERVGRVDMQSLQIGDYLGLERRVERKAVPAMPSQPVRAPVLPRPQANLSVAAPEFRPGPARDLPNAAAPEFRPGAARGLPNVAAPEFRPKAARDLPNVAAPEFRPGAARDVPPAPPRDLCPGVVLQGAGVQSADLERLTRLESATSQTSISSADKPAASWPRQPSQLDAAGRAMSVRSDVSSLQRGDSAAGAPPPPRPRPKPQKLPGMLPHAPLCWHAKESRHEDPEHVVDFPNDSSSVAYTGWSELQKGKRRQALPPWKGKHTHSHLSANPRLMSNARAGLDQLTAIQIVGCTRETLAVFRQLQSEGGFAIKTTDLGNFNMLVEADCTGLLMYENESQMLHGLWKSTRLSDSGSEVHAPKAHPHTPHNPSCLLICQRHCWRDRSEQALHQCWVAVLRRLVW